MNKPLSFVEKFLMQMEVPDGPGTYVIVLELPAETCLELGALEARTFPAGFYVYVGSALGPGGLYARLGHHLGRTEQPHWHIDYLRAVSEPVEVWYVESEERLEHAWAGTLGSMPQLTAFAEGFGSSDCTCATHLFYSPEQPALDMFRERMGGA